MGFVKLKCPSCGADVQLDETRDFCFCTYCGTKIVQDKIVVEHRGKISVDGIADKDSLLERAFNLIHERKFEKASERLDIVLDIDPRCYKAYLGKLMCRVGTRTEGGLLLSDTPLSDYYEYDNALKYANAEQRQFLENANKTTIENKEALIQQALKDKKEKAKKARKTRITKLVMLITALLIVRGFIISDRETFYSKNSMIEYVYGQWNSMDSAGYVETKNCTCLKFNRSGDVVRYRYKDGKKDNFSVDNEVKYNPLWGSLKINDTKYILLEDGTIERRGFLGSAGKYKKVVESN